MQKHAAILIGIGVVLVAAGVAGTMRQVSARAATRLTTQAAGSASTSTFAIANIRLFDGTRMVPKTTVVVRDGRIAAVGPDVTTIGVEVVDGAGRTLLPGLIDSHTHAFGDALERAIVFGVTTELDMFTDHRLAAQARSQQREGAGAQNRADLFSAGTLVTAPKGHGTEYGITIPTISRAEEAAAFVDARIAEGSDYIKIVYDPGGRMPSIDNATLRAVVAAAKARGKLAVVHIGTRAAAEEAIAAGANGLVHLFPDAPPSPDFVSRLRAASAFAIPTLTVLESLTGTKGGAELAADPLVRPFLTAAEIGSLERTFAASPRELLLQNALDTVRQLHQGGVPILAGTDAPNPGTAHGGSIHRELELLARAGLPPEAALAAATSVPAAAFGLKDRGRIAEGLRADLVLIDGDPVADIRATRNIVAIWKGGVRFDRRHAPAEKSATIDASATGLVSAFDGTTATSEFGLGWEISTDSLMGGSSTAAMTIVAGGAQGTRGALEIAGEIKPGSPYRWAGAMFYPGAAQMAPVDLSRFKEIVFRAKGDGRQAQVMLFATRLGNIPATQTFVPGPEWREHVMPFKAFGEVDGSDIRGVLFSAGSEDGAFRFAIDEVRFR